MTSHWALSFYLSTVSRETNCRSPSAAVLTGTCLAVMLKCSHYYACRSVTAWRPSVCASVTSAYSSWLTRWQHANWRLIHMVTHYSTYFTVNRTTIRTIRRAEFRGDEFPSFTTTDSRWTLSAHKTKPLLFIQRRTSCDVAVEWLWFWRQGLLTYLLTYWQVRRLGLAKWWDWLTDWTREPATPLSVLVMASDSRSVNQTLGTVIETYQLVTYWNRR